MAIIAALAALFSLTKRPPDFAVKKEWPWVKAIGDLLRVTIRSGGRDTGEVQHDILSDYLSRVWFSETVRRPTASNRCSGSAMSISDIAKSAAGADMACVVESAEPLRFKLMWVGPRPAIFIGSLIASLSAGRR